MSAQILINKGVRETRVARLENGQLVELHVEHGGHRGNVGNIYKGQASRVLPGMQAAFIDIGLSRTGFLYVNKVVDPNKKEEVDERIEDELEEGSLSGDTEEEESLIANDPIEDSEANISQLLSEGQSTMVQIIKDPIGTKGARLTGYVSIPGRFLVYLPDSKLVGISRRIENSKERTRLKSIIEKHKPKSGGVIVRTVAEGASDKAIKSDLDYLLKLWGSIKKAYDKQNKPGLIHADFDLALRILRDRVTEDVEKIIVDDLALFRKMNKFIQNFLPQFKKRIELYKEKISLFEHYSIEAEISRALARKVWLKSGGYIIIDETEALTSIDVNTGRFVGKRNLEDTIFQTNMEAVKEIAFQIRLRNIGGIIVLDFIDMEKEINRESIFNAFVEELGKDPVRTSVLPVSEFGLIEMTRKRTQESLRQRLTSSCLYCDGKGYVKSIATIAYEILRECEKEAQQSKAEQSLQVYCHPNVSRFLTEDEKAALEEIEQKQKRRLAIKIDPSLHLEEYEIFSKDS